MVSCDVLTKRYIQRRGIHLVRLVVHQAHGSALTDRKGRDDPYATVRQRAEHDLRIASRVSRAGVCVADRIRHGHDRGEVVRISGIRLQGLFRRSVDYYSYGALAEKEAFSVVPNLIEVFTQDVIHRGDSLREH